MSELKTFHLKGAALSAALTIRKLNDEARLKIEALQHQINAAQQEAHEATRGSWTALAKELGVDEKRLQIDASYWDDHGMMFAFEREPNPVLSGFVQQLVGEDFAEAGAGDEGSSDPSAGKVH